MKTASAQKLIVLLAALILALLPLGGALAEDYTAQTMRLLHYEGEVEILDANGKSRFVMENVRFKSGEAMRTGEASTASVSLDATKIVTLDQLSLLEFIKQGNHMLLTLKEGLLLLDVQEKLDENESLDVETSTLTVGIRGTVIVMSEQVIDGVHVSKITVLAGVTQVSYIDANGTRQSFQLSAGYTALLTDNNGNGQVDLPPEIRETTEEDTEGFVDEQLQQNPDTLKRIENENGANQESLRQDDYSYSASGNWQWTGKVTLVAQSASKMYDGTPLVRASDVLVEGLTSEFRCVVSATGFLTDAGNSANPVGDYRIYNSRNEDVTSHFPNVEKINGKLIVEPVPITVWTGSAEKTYDGTPLTNPEAGAVIRRSVDEQSGPETETAAGGFGGGAGAQAATTQNVSYLVDPALKNQTLYGVCGVVAVHAMNPLTGEASDVLLKAGYRLIIYLNDEEGQESLKYETEPVALSDLPEEMLRIYAENPDALKQACQETGWKEEDVKARIAHLKKNASAKMVEQNGIRIVEDEADRLLTDFTNVHINIDSSITNYNGRALNGQEATFVTPPIDGEIHVIPTGSRTDVGESENAYEIEWGTAKKENYVVTEELGSLTVTPAAVTVTTGSAGKVYDGQPLTNSEASITGLAEGEGATVIPNGAVTQVGKAANTYTIDWGTAKQKNYTVSEELGELTVEPLQLSVDFRGGEVAVTDGNLTMPDPILSYGNGPHAGETVTAARTRSLSAAYRFTLFTGDPITIEISAQKRGGGVYDIIATPTYPSGLESSFSIEFVGTVYDKGLQELKITTPSASKTYDGTPLTGTEVTVEGLDEDDTILVTATGSQTEAGSSTNTYTIDWGDTNAGDYTIVEDLGTLTVTPAAVTVTTGSAGKVYDGQPLTNSEASITGLAEGEGATVIPNGAVTQVGKAANTYTIDWGTAKQENYTVSEELGELTVEPLQLSVDFRGGEVAVTDGNLTMPDPILSYGNGPHAGETVTAARTRSLSAAYRFTLFTGDPITIEISAQKRGGGVYDIIATPTYPSGLESSFSIEFVGTVFEAGLQELKITTPSASKTYDGTPLTGTEVTVEGLDEDDTILVTATGSQTEAGSSTNTYTIDWGDTNAGDYVIVEELGTLSVEPKTVTITTGSASKSYDGTALTCADPSPALAIDGLIDGDGATVTATGAITAVGTAENTYSIVWDEGTDAGNYAIVESLGTLTVSPAQVSITTKSASKEYDGQPLTCWELESNYTVAGMENVFTITLENGEWMTVTIQGSQTDVAQGSNTCQEAWSGAASGNYEIAWNLGALTVTQHTSEVVLTAASAIKKYDGTPLTAAEATGLPEWFSVVPTMTNESTQTEVGFCDNVIESHMIYLDDEDVTDNFTNVKYANGKLTVTNAEVLSIMATAEKTYDGTPLSATAENTTVTLEPALEGYTAEVTMSGSLTDAGSTDAEITSFTIRKDGEDVTALFPNVTTAGVLVVKKFPVQIVTGNKTMAYNGSALHSDDLTVNGSAPAQTDEVYREYKLIGSDKLTQMVTAAQTELGKTTNVCSYSLEAVANPNNYDISEAWGELEVTAQTVTVQLVNSAAFQGLVTPDAMTAVYKDGSAVTCIETENESGKLTSKFRLTDNSVLTVECLGVGAGDHTYEPTCAFSKENNDKNYLVSFTNTEVSIDPLAVTIGISCPEEVEYDGESHEPVLTVNQPSESYTWQTADDETGDKLLVWAWGDVFRLHLNAECGEDIEIPETDAGEYAFSLTCGIDTGDAGNYSISLPEGESTMTIKPVPVTITTGDGEKMYNGTELTKDQLSVNGTPLTKEDGVYKYSLVGEDVLTATVTGAVTDVTEATGNNTCDYSISGNSNNYAVTVIPGTLTVTANNSEVKLTAPSKTETYDGSLLAPTDPPTVTGLPDGFTVTDVTYTGGRQDAGTSDYTVNNYEIYTIGSDPKNVTGWFTNVTKVAGKLTVNPKLVIISTGSTERQYNGEPLTFTGSPTFSGLVGDDGITVTITGSQTDVGECQMDYTVDGWTGGAKASNYTIEPELGKLIVTQNSSTVVIKADSAEKPYDGTALTKATATATGLPDGFTVSVTMTAGSTQTDAGSATNEISTYSILNGSGEDVKECFANVSTETGMLTVNPKPITVTTGSAERQYNGTTLTSATASISGLVEGETATATANGSQTIVGNSSNTYTIEWDTAKEGNYSVTNNAGTLTVTQNTGAVVIKADSAEKSYDGTALTKATATATGLPDGFTVSVTMTAGSTLTDAGSATNEISTYSILNGSGEDMKECFANVSTETGTLTVNKYPVTLATGSDSKVYDGTKLTKDQLSVDGTPLTKEDGVYKYSLVGEDVLTATVTGAVTDVTEATGNNTCDYSISGNSNNYAVTFVPGTLQIQPLSITVTLAMEGEDYSFNGYQIEPEIVNASYVKDGETAYLDYEYNEETDAYDFFLPYGGKLSVKPEGVYGAGEHTFTATTSVSGTAAENYSVTVNGATINVDPLIVTLWPDDENGSYDYDGQPHGNANLTIGVSSLGEEDYDIQNLGGGEFKIVWNWGDEITVHVTGSESDAGEHELSASGEVTKGSGSNYAIDIADEDFTYYIYPAPLSLRSSSGDKPFDGTPLTCYALDAYGCDESPYGCVQNGNVFTVTLVNGETITVTVNGSQTEVGESKNTYTVAWGETKASNYDVDYDYGTLTVKYANTVTVDASATKQYDGTKLTANSEALTVTGLPEGCTVEATVTGSQTNVGSSDVTFTSCKILKDGEDVTHMFTVETKGTLEVTPRIVTLKLDGLDENIVYDGAYHGNWLTVEPGDITKECTGNGEGQWRVETKWGDVISVFISGGGIDAGDYTLGCDWSVTTGTASNYSISVTGATMTIKPASLAITSGSDSKQYDGTPLTCYEIDSNYQCARKGDSNVFTVTLENEETITVTVKGSQTEKDTGKNSFEVAWEDTNSANYNLTEITGELEVTANHTHIIITAPSYEERYNGWEHNLDTDQPHATNVPDGFYVDASKDDLVAPVDVTVAPIAVVDYTISFFNGTNWEDVPKGYFDNVETVAGFIRIVPIEVSLEVYGDYEYDDSEHYGATYVNAEITGPYSATVVKTGETANGNTWDITVNEMDYTFTLTTTGGGTEAGTYPLTCTVSGVSKNYAVSIDSSEGVFIGKLTD